MDLYKAGSKKDNDQGRLDRQDKDKSSRYTSTRSYRNSNRGYEDRRPRQPDRERVHTDVVCADCGVQCTVPFVPQKGGRPVLCNDCFRRGDDSRRTYGNRERRDGNNRYGDSRHSQRRERTDYSDYNDRRRQPDRERVHTDVVCADCGVQCTVPFVPQKGGRPVLCNDCFRRGDDSRRTYGNRERRDGNNRYGDSRHSQRRERTDYSDYNDRRRQPDRERVHTDVVCADCGVQCTVPFVPQKGGRPVLCDDCFRRGDKDEYNKGRDSNHTTKYQSQNDKDDRRDGSSQQESQTFSRLDPNTESTQQKQSKTLEAAQEDQPKFYAHIREKLFEILGGKICSVCGFRDERALGFSHIYGEMVFDDIKRGGTAASWNKYILDSDLAQKEIKVLCMNCSRISLPRARPKSDNKLVDSPKRTKSKFFPR